MRQKCTIPGLTLGDFRSMQKVSGFHTNMNKILASISSISSETLVPASSPALMAQSMALLV